MNQGSPVKIVVLYAEVMGYVVGTLKALMKCGRNVEIDVVFWDKKTISLFVIGNTGLMKFHARSSLSDEGLVELLQARNPDIICVSGWMDKGYLSALRRYRRQGGRGQVVCGLDGQWKDTLRQYLGSLYFRLFYAKLFDFMWVAGKPQYHFAQRLGYGHERIVTNLYSADNEIFSAKGAFSRRFVFVGRFDPVKALDQLIEAYLSLPEDVQLRWPLVLIGDGELRRLVESRKASTIIIKPFLQPEELMQELRHGGVSCITSHQEPWGVAIHEMAILGFPLVLSSACGAATEFLISGYNGFMFRRSNTASLRAALLKIAMLDDSELESFSRRSHELGMRINSEHSAYSLLSAIPLSVV